MTIVFIISEFNQKEYFAKTKILSSSTFHIPYIQFKILCIHMFRFMNLIAGIIGIVAMSHNPSHQISYEIYVLGTSII